MGAFCDRTGFKLYSMIAPAAFRFVGSGLVAVDSMIASGYSPELDTRHVLMRKEWCDANHATVLLDR
jgi:hypothetical protein